MDEKIEGALTRYVREIAALPNESAKTHRFVELLGELFAGATEVTQFIGGIENAVRVNTGTGTKAGRIDAYHGNAIIEFEKSLAATEATAIKQLREYSVGAWKKDKHQRPLIAVASDGIVWKTFAARLKPGFSGDPTPKDVILEPLRAFTVTKETTRDFWIWLTGFLFREGQTVPTTERFKYDFGATSPAFADARDALHQAWKAVQKEPEPHVAFDTWLRYLTVTYGDVTEETEDLRTLFMKHTYLVSVARLLIWAALSKGKFSGTLRNVARSVLTGEYFEAERIENLVEDDFFQWVRHPKAEEILAPVWERTIAQMLTYDLSLLRQDVLKGVYQELIDPADRHELGEYYTPDWLCEQVVDVLLPDEGFASVLDPSCGSGSFLRAVITHFLDANPDGGDAKRLRAVLDNVVGIDIHPVAVTISRATYLLAVRKLLKATKRPIQIPVYLADALFLPSEVSQKLLGKDTSYEIKFGGDKSVLIPETLVRSPELFDPAIAAATEVATAHAKTKGESRKSLRSYLQQRMPEILETKISEEIVDALWNFANDLADLIRKHKNSIWAFVVRNAYRPAMLRERFDYIVGNPPWLSYRYISDPEYQAEVKRLAITEYKIAPNSQKLMTQMELATVFLVHAMSTFAKVGAELAFVMPRSVLSADQHMNLREVKYTAPVTLDEYWDLDEVSPLFNVPTCVLFASKPAAHFVKNGTYSLPAVEWKGNLPGRDLSWDEASEFLTETEQTAKLIYLGSHTALSTQPGRTKPNAPSPYAEAFHQGATIVPRSVYFVRVKDLSLPVESDRYYWAETDPDQAEEAKPPYRDVYLSGQVEGRFLYYSVLSKNVLPFLATELPTVVLPLDPDGAKLRVLTAKELNDEGYREFAKWMAAAEKIWNTKRDKKAEKQSLYERLDYQSGLTAQQTGAKHLVLYNAAGTNLSAVHLRSDRLELPFVVEHKLYWASFKSAREADYVTAILNSEQANYEIKPFQTRGQQGERDIEKKILELPIPAFDPTSQIHLRIAELGARAADEALQLEVPETRSLGRVRGFVRAKLCDALDEIDSLVKKLW